MGFILGQRVALNSRKIVLRQSRMTRYPDFLLESGYSCFKLVNCLLIVDFVLFINMTFDKPAVS